MIRYKEENSQKIAGRIKNNKNLLLNLKTG